MPTVRLMLRHGCTVEDEHGELIRIPPERDLIDLDKLSPRARALAEAIAETPDAGATEIWVESDLPIRERLPEEQWQMWYGEERANQPDRRPWSAWLKFRADDPSDPHGWLERQAAKIPAGWHVLGAHPYKRVATGETGMTIKQVLETLHSYRHIRIEPATWRSYVSRGQAPQPVRRVGRTPLWDPTDILAWERPGQGARTDLARDGI